MENFNGQGKIRSFIEYLPGTLKFYDLKNEKLTPVIFVIVLAISFIGNLLPMFLLKEIDFPLETVNTENLYKYMSYGLFLNGINFVVTVISNYFLSIYLYAFILDLRGIGYDAAGCWKYIFSRSFGVIFLSIITTSAVYVGMTFLIIPGVILYLLFIVSNCFLVDKNEGALSALKSSIKAVRGHKSRIFGVAVTYYMLVLLIQLMLDISVGPLIYAFISSFLSTIFNISYQRLISFIYMDLQPDNMLSVKL